MKNSKTQKIVIIVTAIFIVAAVLLMFGGNIFKGSGSGSSSRTDMTVMPEATDLTAEIKRSTVIEQEFVSSTDDISKVGIVFARDRYLEGVHMVIELLEGNTVLASNSVNVAKIEDQHRTYVEPASKLTGMKGKTLKLRIYCAEKEDTGMKIMMSKDVKTTFKFGNKTIDGTLCFSVTE